jgi:hypothetical protein
VKVISSDDLSNRLSWYLLAIIIREHWDVYSGAVSYTPFPAITFISHFRTSIISELFIKYSVSRFTAKSGTFHCIMVVSGRTKQNLTCSCIPRTSCEARSMTEMKLALVLRGDDSCSKVLIMLVYRTTTGRISFLDLISDYVENKPIDRLELAVRPTEKKCWQHE